MPGNRLPVAALALALVTAACATTSGGEGSPAAPDATPTSVAAVTTAAAPRARTPLPGFGEIAFRVSTMPNALRCALLAETAAQHGRGLMQVTDLGGYDGMLFVFEVDRTGAFYMLNTPMPLSIAWFDANGRFVSSTDMEPCLGSADCPLYRPAAPYRYALEVPQGGLAGLGIGPGAVITAGGPCP